MSTPVFWSGFSDLDAGERRDGAQQGDAAAGRHAFLHRGAGGVERVVDAVLLFLDLDFGRAADADDRDAAGELGKPLLQLLTVVIRGGFLDLRLDLGDARLRCPSCRRRRRRWWCFPCRCGPSWRGRASASVTFSSLMPMSSEITWPPVRMAMSSSMALRRSPKPAP